VANIQFAFPSGVDLYVAGNITSQTLTVPSGTITNAMVSASAAIDSTKLVHRYKNTVQVQDSTANAAVGRLLIHRAKAAGTLIAFDVGSVTAATGDSTTTVDLKKNGSTVLTGTIQLDSGNTAFVTEAGTFTATPYVAGDVFEFHITAVSAGTGTLPKGVFGTLSCDEPTS